MSNLENQYINYYDDISELTSIEFSILSNKDILKESAITDNELGITQVETEEKGFPKRGSVIDKRLGITSYGYRCETCGLKTNLCPGHFGHINLAEPVFHIGLIDHLKNVLNCICINCGKLLKYKKETEIENIIKKYNDKKRFLMIKEIVKNIPVCKSIDENGYDIYGCGQDVGKIKINKDNYNGTLNFISEIEKKELSEEIKSKPIIKILTAKNVYEILKKITDSDWSKMGFDSKKYRPEDLIIKNFPIPPIIIRPSTKTDTLSSGIYEDKLMHHLINIVKANKRIVNNKQISNINIENDITLLQCHIGSFYDNNSSKLPCIKVGGQGNKNEPSISSRLKGKPGRIRQNLLAKRVNFSARTVITSDPSLSIDEVGVPIKIAMNLTFPEIVTNENKIKLMKYIENGVLKYPGANRIIFKNEKYGNLVLKDLSIGQKIKELKNGWIVERHLIDGDYVLFNRQPSLHRMSMMGHKVKVINNPQLNTFRLNVSVTTPYNADFDGDEMNMYPPQSIQTQVELANLIAVKYNIISPAVSKAIITHKQDTIIGTYLMSIYDKQIIGYDISYLIHGLILPKKTNIIKNKLYKTNEILSLIIPTKINIIEKNDKGEIKIEIKNGNLTKGKIGKSELSNLLIRNILEIYDEEEAKNFIDNLQKLVLKWFLINGFTVGIKDCILKEEYRKEIWKIVESKKLQIKYSITEMENYPDMKDKDLFEKAEIKTELEALGLEKEVPNLIFNDIDIKNNFYVMIESGSKGKKDNFSQIVAFKGQDTIEFERVPKKINRRTFVHYYQNDDSAEARGFIERAYIDGLQPHEFFIHLMSGRVGIVDTAIRTAESGYMQRQLIKLLEDLKVTYDMTVRISNNVIVQFNYGDNGLDQIHLKNVKLTHLEEDNKNILEKYTFNNTEISDIIKNVKNITKKEIEQLNKEMYNDLIEIRDILRESLTKSMLLNKLVDISLPSCIDFYRLTQSYKNEKIEYNNPKIMYEKILSILDNTKTVLLPIKKSKLKKYDEQIYKLSLKAFILEYLNPKILMLLIKITRNQLEELIKYIINKYNKCVVNPGEMVGCIAGQSMGEKLTQMTLNTFHSAGTGVEGMKNIPRIREIIHHIKTEKIEFKQMKIITTITEENNKETDSLNKLGIYLKNIMLYEIVNKIEIIYDTVKSFHKKDNMIDVYLVLNGKQSININNLIITYRLELNDEKLYEYEFNNQNIMDKIYINWKNNFTGMNIDKKNKVILNKILECVILRNHDNDKKHVLHIKLRLELYDKDTLNEIGNFFLSNIKLNGLNDIEKTDTTINDCIKYNKNGEKIKTKSLEIKTKGINMIDIRYIKNIDIDKTICNDITIMNELYGIEVARNLIIKELYEVYANSSNTINYQHIELLGDVMTNIGEVVSTNRYGISKLDPDVLSKASFEKQVEQLLTSSIFNEIDPLRSISSRIMVGKTINGGTGYGSLTLDTEMLNNIETIKEETRTILEKDDIINDILSQ